MGYTGKRTFLIRFGEGHELEGLEVRMRSVSVGRLLELVPQIDALDSIGAAMTPQDAEEIKHLFGELASMIHSWNVEDEDEGGDVVPVPATAEGLMAQDLRLVTCLFQEWTRHISGVPAPLERPSPSGDPSLEASLPMEMLSASPAS